MAARGVTDIVYRFPSKRRIAELLVAAMTIVRLHIATQDGVDAGLIASLFAEPRKKVSIQSYGYNCFTGGHDDLGISPKGFIRRPHIRIRVDVAVNLGRGHPLEAGPIGADVSSRQFGRCFSSSVAVRAVLNATPRRCAVRLCLHLHADSYLYRPL